MKVSLSPSPDTYEIVSPYIHVKQVESMQSNVWERIRSLSAPSPGPELNQNRGVLSMSVLDGLEFRDIKLMFIQFHLKNFSKHGLNKLHFDL